MGEKEGRSLTVMLIPDGDGGQESTRTFRVGYGRVRLIAGLLGLLALGLLVVLGSWVHLAARASRVADLEAEVARLQEERGEVLELARQLDDLERRYDQVRSLFGSGESETPELWLPAPGAGTAARRGEEAESPSLPTSWPLTESGFVTQTLLEGTAGAHPGLDIAVPTDSYVRAAGAGTVAEVGSDPVYGNFVVLEHVDGYRSLYAHASQVLVTEGAVVRRNEVIALSGSTGRSTAPHLHFEIQRDGETVDPMTLLTPL